MVNWQLIAVMVLSGLLLFSPTVNADSKHLQQQRKWFEQAEYAARKSRVKEFNRLYKKLDGYPLQAYAELAYLKQHPYLSNKKRIQTFLSLYEGTPLDWSLRIRWLKYLAKKKQAVTYLADYKTTSNAELRCHKYRFELAIGGTLASLADDIEKLWVVGQSQPKACDPLFRVWKKAGYQTTNLVKRRIKLAASEGEHTLLPYLIKQLPAKDRQWGQNWRKVRRDPTQVAKLSRFDKNRLEDMDILVYGLKRLIWKKPELALKTFNRAEKRFQLRQKQLEDLYGTFALALANKHDDRALTWYNKLAPSKLNKANAHWLLATYLRKNDWVNVATLVQTLPKPLSEELIYQYWLSRAQHQLGISKTADNRLKMIAKQRHYYGFLASAYLQQKPSLNAITPDIDTALINKVANAPGAKRAYEFLQINRATSARREWWHFKRSLTKQEKTAAAQLAKQWQWHDQALRTVSQAGLTDAIAMRFPFAYADTFKKYSKQAGIDASLAFAVARRESNFMTDAHSTAGARGLMQLMPGTAKRLAGSRVSNAKLYQAKLNVRLGTKYLGQLIDRVDGQIPLAIASYNAGYYKVIKWLPTDKPVNLDLWIETIPYKETREYVKGVLAYQQVYEYQLNPESDIFAPLIHKQVILEK